MDCSRDNYVSMTDCHMWNCRECVYDLSLRPFWYFVNHEAQALNCRHFEIKFFKHIYDILGVVSAIPFDNNQNMRQLCFLKVWQWDYFVSALWQIALCMIQFAKAVFSANSLCMLEFSILIKILHKIFGHSTHYVIFFWSFVLLHGFQQLFCMTCWGTSFYSILHTAVKWNCTLRWICSCAQIVGEHLVQHMQIRTY